MRRFLISAAGFLAMATASVGCSFSYGVDEGFGFSCASDDDCVPGFFCAGLDQLQDGETGRCVSDDAPGTGCVDNDNDSFFAIGCTEVAANQLDCDDNNAEINPGAEEICDGIDNNCNCDRTSGDTNADQVVCGSDDDGVDEDLPPRNCALRAGVCAGASIECINGTYPIAQCDQFGAYPDTFERGDETLCDGLDNNCDGQVDEGDCDCQLDNLAARECGRDTGSCTRGITVCEEDASRSTCLSAIANYVCEDGTACVPGSDCDDDSLCAPETCTADEDCTAQENGYCVEELVNVVESIYDSCAPGSSERNCPRSVCRYLEGIDSCTTSEDCDTDQVCIAGACQVGNIAPLATDICNGIDDDCDGTIDSPGPRNPCGQCPYNSLLANVNNRSQPFICIDRYEASRPDATATDAGSFDLYSTSEVGVIPWTGLSSDDANTACSGRPYNDAVGITGRLAIATKRLCNSTEWQQGCGGIAGLNRLYPYADTTSQDDFQEGTCIDGSRGVEGPQRTGTATECCYAPNESFPDSPTCDMVGNVAEWVRSPGQLPVLAGGSYQDTDPGILSCGNGTSYQAAPDVDSFDGLDTIGFRCCTIPAQ
jgi:hypothetical protein